MRRSSQIFALLIFTFLVTGGLWLYPSLTQEKVAPREPSVQKPESPSIPATGLGVAVNAEADGASDDAYQAYHRGWQQALTGWLDP